MADRSERSGRSGTKASYRHTAFSSLHRLWLERADTSGAANSSTGSGTCPLPAAPHGDPAHTPDCSPLWPAMRNRKPSWCSRCSRSGSITVVKSVACSSSTFGISWPKRDPLLLAPQPQKLRRILHVALPQPRNAGGVALRHAAVVRIAPVVILNGQRHLGDAVAMLAQATLRTLSRFASVSPSSRSGYRNQCQSRPAAYWRRRRLVAVQSHARTPRAVTSFSDGCDHVWFPMFIPAATHARSAPCVSGSSSRSTAFTKPYTPRRCPAFNSAASRVSDLCARDAGRQPTGRRQDRRTSERPSDAVADAAGYWARCTATMGGAK